MNNVTLIGRLTRDPDIRINSGKEALARFTLAVQRTKDEVDFISCYSVKKNAEVAEKYFKQGMKIAVTGSIRTGSYTNKDGQKIYTTSVLVTSQEFIERKLNTGDNSTAHPEGYDEELPFN